jgi:glutaredoxin 3
MTVPSNVQTPAQTQRIVVYTTDPCARCIKAKALLGRHDLLFEEINLAKDPVGRRDLVALTGQMTFPQIVVGHEPIGGLDELEQAAASGRLAELAGTSPPTQNRRRGVT